ncbi:MAG: hypothetical protein KME03_20215 [Aphanocapsa lilacina HA4352-LM1]|jgi:hypothetical protein|nr:hypothetical protein [Aphanocapsa lilacina HA4352-LM1]
MNSEDIARYIEATDSLSKPWLLVQLRIAMLRERRGTLSPEEYACEFAELHRQLMALGQWWKGIEGEAFGEF